MKFFISCEMGVPPVLKNAKSIFRIAVFWLMLPLVYAAYGQKPIYHYTPEGRVYFEKLDKKLLVKFSANTDFATMERLLATEPILVKPKKEQILPAPQGAVILELNGSPSEEKIKALTDRLLKYAEIEYVSPVLKCADGTSQAATDQFMVKLKKPADLKKLQEYVKGYNATIVKQYEYDPLVYVIKASKFSKGNALDLANQLAETGLFATAEPDMMRLLHKLSTNDTFLNYQWALNNTGSTIQFSGTPGADMKVFSAWSVTTGAATVKTAILDDGVELTHPDLAANILSGYDATGLGSGGAPSAGDAHGTACAGIVAAAGNNNAGIAGIAYTSKIVPVRIAYSSGASWVTLNSWIASAIDWAWNNAGADVLSNSWGGGTSSTLINDAINRAITNGRGGKGSIVLFAAGNSNSNILYPANLSTTVAVGASTMCDTRKTFSSCDGEDWWASNTGAQLDVMAPGVKIYTTDRTGASGYSSGDYVAEFNGTSAACPHAAGVAALIISANSTLTQSQVRQILESTCDKVGGVTYAVTTGKPNGTWNIQMGYGRVNALAAVNAANPTACTTPPATATTIASKTFVCGSASVSFGLSGISFGSGQTYQWQHSTDGITYTNITGATSSTLVTTVSTTRWYRCNVTCGSQTTPSTPIQVSVGSGIISTFPTSVDFDSEQSLCGWTVSDANNDGRTWVVNNIYAKSAPNNFTYFSNPALAANDWLFSPGLQLVAGKTYRVTFWQRVRNASNTSENLEVRWGNNNTPSSMTLGTLYSGTGLTNSEYTLRTTSSFTPSTNGTYYVGFRVFSPANQWDLIIDDVTFEEVPPCTTPPVAGTASGPSSGTAGDLLTYNLTGYSGHGIQWQVSTDGGSTWSDIEGANSAALSVRNRPGNYRYRALVSKAGCDDAISNSVATTVAPRAGDNQSNAITVTLPYSGSHSTADGSGYSNTYSGPFNQPSPDVFFTFTTGPCTDRVAISTCGSGFDTYLHVLTGTGSHIVSNDDNGVLCAGTSASLRVNVSPNTTYIVVVEGFSSQTGTFTLNIEEDLENPFTATITPSGPTTFCSGGSVTLTANTGVSYLWSNGATTQSITVSASGTFTVTVTNSAGCVDESNPVTVTVNPLPTVFTLSGDGTYCTASPGATVNLSGSQTGVSYTLKFVDGPDVTTVAGTGSTLTISGITGSGTLVATAQNTSTGCTANMNGSVEIVPIIATAWYRDADNDGYGSLTDSVLACSQPTGYIATSGDCNDNNANVNPGMTEICGNGIDDDCDGVIDAGDETLPDPGYIMGPGGVCRGNSGITFSVNPVPGAELYQWTLPTGATGTSTTNSITLSFNNTFVTSNICVKAIKGCVESPVSCRSVVRYTARPATPGSISGVNTGICPGYVRTFSIAPVTNAETYTWTVPANSIILSGQGTTSIQVEFLDGFTGGILSVNATNCVGTSSNRNLTLSTTVATPAAISGASIGVCPGSTGTYSVPPVAGAIAYIWTLPAGATIISGDSTNSVVIQFGPTFTSGTLRVASYSGCFTSSNRSLNISSVPPFPGLITGPTLGACGGVPHTYSIAPVTGATSYNWEFPAGTTVLSGAGTNIITVEFPIGFVSGTVRVAAVNACGSSNFRSITVRGLPGRPTNITGPINNVCAGNYFYSIAAVPGATSYNWTVPASWTIVQNLGTQIEVSVPGDFVSGTVSVSASNACGTGDLRSVNVIGRPGLPATIVGPTSVCAGDVGLNYSTNSIPGLIYNWTVPSGASITDGVGTSSITVNWGTVSGNVRVTASNSCGVSSARTLRVTVVPCRVALPVEPESDKLDLKVYPNPGKGIYTINFNQPLKNDAELKVYNLLGKLLIDSKVDAGQTEYKLNIESMPAGLYIVKVSHEQSTLDVKIIKQ